MRSDAIYIPSIDAKDLYLSNHTIAPNPNGFSLYYRNGEINMRRFYAALPYSLDQIKLREVYHRVYMNRRLTFVDNGKEYSKHVVCVTFNYAIKAYNKIGAHTYVKNGYVAREMEFVDHVCVRDGELLGIECEQTVERPLGQGMLGKYFRYEDGRYIASHNIDTLVSVADLRRILYRDGFVIDGKRYVRYKRSSGSARVGKCLFIDEALYSRMHRYDMCGLRIYDGAKVDLAALEAYIALTASSIIGTIDIRPENILVIDDYESTFRDDVVATGADQGGRIVTEYTSHDVTNSIWDGQSLIQTDLLGPYAQYGFVLLRNRFFKSACFNCDIQRFFADHGITSLDQIKGTTRAQSLEDIKLITTPSSIKYLKFGTFNQWLDNIDTTFGVVKHEKPTHFFDGRMVQTHYQLINTLQLSQAEVDELLKPSLDYVRALKTDPAVLRMHIGWSAEDEPDGPLLSKNKIVYKLLGINERYTQTMDYFEFRSDLMKSYIKDLRKGKILVEGNYSVLCGNPIEMLWASIGQFDGVSRLGVGNVMSVRFPYGITLLGSRSPHITIANVWVPQNIYNEEIATYMVTTPEILYINSIGENILQRLSGSDFDSDSVLLTNNQLLIKAAKRNIDFRVPTSLIKAAKANLHYTDEDKAGLDIRTSVNKIGEIINLSQELNSRLWGMLNSGAQKDSREVLELYKDIAQLDVMSGCEIDKAKKVLPIDNVAELKLLKEKYLLRDSDGRKIRPNFFSHIARDKGYYDNKRINYKMHRTAMDYVQHTINRNRISPRTGNSIPLSAIFEKHIRYNCVNRNRIRRIIALMRDCRAQEKMIWADTDMDAHVRYEQTQDIRIRYAQIISRMTLTKVTAYWLIRTLEKPENNDVRKAVLQVLFGTANQSLYELLDKSRGGVSTLVEDPDGDVVLYGFRYKHIKIPDQPTISGT